MVRCSSLFFFFFFFNDTATTEIYTLSLHDTLPISDRPAPSRRHSIPWVLLLRVPGRSGSREVPAHGQAGVGRADVTRSEEHTSELQSLAYLVCRLLLEKKKITSHDSHARLCVCHDL